MVYWTPDSSGPLGGSECTSSAYDINNNGDIVGTINGGTPVVWSAGSAAPMVLPIPGGRYPHSVSRINDSGDVVGTVSAVYPAFYSAALWHAGEFIDLGVLPIGIESYAYDISNAGVIVGTSTTGTPYGSSAAAGAGAIQPRSPAPPSCSGSRSPTRQARSAPSPTPRSSAH